MDCLRQTIYKKNILIFFTFVTLSAYFYIRGYKESIPAYMEFMKWGLTLFCIWSVYQGLHSKLRVSHLVLINSIITLLFVFLLRFLFMENVGEIFGPAVDSYGYLYNGVQNADLSYWDFCKKIQYKGFKFDDLGYFSIYYWAAQFSRDVSIVAGIVSLFNIVLLYFSSCYLFRLGKIVCNNEYTARIVSILWSSFPFILMTIAVGLKENCFCSIIIFALYHSYNHKWKGKRISLLYAFLFALLAFLFRTAIGCLLLIAIIVNGVVNRHNAKKLLIIGFIGCLMLNLLLPMFIGLMGGNYESITGTTSYRMTQKDGGSEVGQLLPIVSSFFGPFPNLDRTDAYNFMAAYSHFLKVSTSLFFLLGAARIIFRLDIRWFALLLYILGNILMLMIAGVGLDLRFHITYIPFFLLLAFDSFHIKRSKWLYPAYYWGIILVIYVYASRAF